MLVAEAFVFLNGQMFCNRCLWKCHVSFKKKKIYVTLFLPFFMLCCVIFLYRNQRYSIRFKGQVCLNMRVFWLIFSFSVWLREQRQWNVRTFRYDRYQDHHVKENKYKYVKLLYFLLKDCVLASLLLCLISCWKLFYRHLSKAGF